MFTAGCFYVVYFGQTEREVEEQFEIAQKIFALPEAEKQEYRVDPERQVSFGWKLRGNWKQQHGLVNALELYDDPNYNEIYSVEFARPDPLEEAGEKAEAFQRHLHFHVLRRLLILSAIILELPDEEALWKLHDYESRSQCNLRYMLQHSRTSHELDTMGKHNIEHNIEHNVDGGTEFGTFTLLMRQPVAAMQVSPYGQDKWKWVKPSRESITVNVADILSFLTGGYLESSIHRFILPPQDQRHIPRYGVIYVAGPDDDTPLEPVESPLLERVKVQSNNA